VKDLYSSVAPFYSFLAKLVFGSSLVEAKLFHLEGRSLGKILIIGGGDGFDYLDLKHPINGEFWEKSESMLLHAKKNLHETGLSFYLGDFADSAEVDFDEIWLHFVLDTLKDEELTEFLETCRSKLSENGKIYLTDFYSPVTSKQKLIHKSMIRFFKVAAAYPRNKVPDYEKFLSEAGLIKTHEKKFKKGWIRSSVWKIRG